MFKILTKKCDGEGSFRLVAPSECEKMKVRWKCSKEAARHLATNYGPGMVVDMEGKAVLTVV